MMKDFFYKIERFLINLLVICLILLVVSQMIIKDDRAVQRIVDLRDNIYYTFENILHLEDHSIEVSNQNNIKEGFIRIKLLQGISLPEVYILKNGKKVDNFKNNEAVIIVKNGDVLALDSRTFYDPLWFEIVYLSDNISFLTTGHQYRTEGNLVNIGVIKLFDEKI